MTLTPVADACLVFIAERLRAPAIEAQAAHRADMAVRYRTAMRALLSHGQGGLSVMLRKGMR